MTSFVLVLSITATFQNAYTLATTAVTIGGFDSEARCVAAADRAKKQLSSKFLFVHATCLSK